jgi:hypothetical protein
MSKTSYWAVVVAAVTAFAAGASRTSPSLLGETNRDAQSVKPAALVETSPSAGELRDQFASSPVIIYSLAHVVVHLGTSDWNDAVEAGSWVRAGFQGLRLLGVVLHAEIPWKLCAFSAGEALAKTLFAAILAGGWRW